MSLRRRVLLGVVAVAVVLVATNLVLSRTFEADLVGRLDDELVETARRPALGRRPGPAGGQPEPLTDLYIAFVDGTGVTRLGSSIRDVSPPVLDADEVRGRTGGFTVGSDDGTSWRLVAVATRAGRGVLVVGRPLDDVEATLDRMRVVQVVGSAAVLAALAAVAWWVLRLGVRPVVAMARTADDIAGGELAARVEHPDERTEAGRLGAALNAMLDRIEEAFRQREASEDRVRRFAADASHEMRTPLTSIRGYAELWQAGGLRGEGELDEAMRRMAEEGARMGAMVDDLLLLARLDRHRPLERAPVRLDRLAADGVADARAVEPDRPVTVDVVPAVVDGDEHHLRQVVANLLANARVHTPPGTPVHVRVDAGDAVVRLVVADEGPGMEADVAAKAFERFYRADQARTRASGGSGLGLSIVAAVAEAHGGRATVTSAPGAGARFVVELPSVAS